MTAFIKKRFVRHLAFYTGFAFLNKGISFLLIPLFTRYLTPEDYGIYALFLTAVLVCEPLLSFCVHDAIGNVYFDQSRFTIREYVSTFLLFSACMFALQTSCLGLFVLFPLSAFKVPGFLLLAPLVSMSNIIIVLLAWMWQLTERPVPYGKFNFCFLLSQLLLQVYVTAFLKLGWRGVLFAQGTLAFVTILVGLVLLRKNDWIGLTFNKSCLRLGLKFGLGYIPNVLAVRLNDSTGKWFVARGFDLASTGIYSAGQKLGMIVGVYNSSFISAYRPWLFKKLTAGDAKERRKILLSVALAFASIISFACAGSLGMYLFSGFFLGESFKNAVVYVFWSTFAYALYGMYCVVSLFIYNTGKSWILSLLTVTTAGLNILFTWRFIKTSGMIGAAYAPVLAWAITLVLSIVVAAQLWKNKPPLGNVK
jgi:O-antigen/teichoic acid export membrane protein